jgi:hypothetical protein
MIRSSAGTKSSAGEEDDATWADEEVNSFYCSQLVEYCYTAIMRRTFRDVPISEIFPPAALSVTAEMANVSVAGA